MILTPNQVDELLKVLDRYMWTFLVRHVGPEVLTDEQKRVLFLSGVPSGSLSGTAYNIEEAYKFGILSQSLGEAAAKQMNYPQLKAYLESGPVFGLNRVERAALESLKYQTAAEVLRFGDKVKSSIKELLVQADKKRNTVTHHSIVTDAAKKAIQDKKYVTEVVSQIGKATGVWERDLGRIADYVLHQAFDEGRAAGAVRESGEHALVYKDVYPGACHSCSGLYLTAGVGSEPKVFTVAELQANGTNIGRKQADWKPVVGVTHPWCRCTLNKTPPGFTLEALKNKEWVWNGLVFEKAKRETPRRERAKVKVQIGNKTIEV